MPLALSFALEEFFFLYIIFSPFGLPPRLKLLTMPPTMAHSTRPAVEVDRGTCRLTLTVARGDISDCYVTAIAAWAAGAALSF